MVDGDGKERVELLIGHAATEHFRWSKPILRIDAEMAT